MNSAIHSQAKLLVVNRFKRWFYIPALCTAVLLVGCGVEEVAQPVSPPAIVFTSDLPEFEEPRHENIYCALELYLMNLDGTEVVRLTKTIGPEQHPGGPLMGRR